MTKRIAFFDFDGTITYKDSFLEMIRFSFGSTKYYIGLLLTSPSILLWKLHLISNQQAKEAVMRYFFGKMPIQNFNELCKRFADEKIPSMIRPKAIQEIKKLQELGADVIIVSASPENWLQPWCQSHNLALIGTRMEIINERTTGKILGANCHGQEKVRRIRESYELTDYDELYAYGDTKGDKPMLALATLAFYQPFR